MIRKAFQIFFQGIHYKDLSQFPVVQNYMRSAFQLIESHYQNIQKFQTLTNIFLTKERWLVIFQKGIETLMWDIFTKENISV